MNHPSLDVQRKPARDKGHVPGEPELWIFILGDMAVFAVFFGILAVNHALRPALFAMGRTHLNLPFGLANTVVLLTSSYFVASALRAARNGRGDISQRLYQGAILLGVVFAGVKFLEYRAQVEVGEPWIGNDFCMFFFVFTGIHLLHVLIGMLALHLASRRCASRRFSPADLPFLEGAGAYWHMVDAVWVVLFLLLYLV
jgi:nitric oxide reductase NorE protein